MVQRAAENVHQGEFGDVVACGAKAARAYHKVAFFKRGLYGLADGATVIADSTHAFHLPAKL